MLAALYILRSTEYIRTCAHELLHRFLIPLGMALGAGVSWPQFLMANLLPVTLGNIVGGAVAVCGLYSSSFGSLFGKKA